MIQQKEKNREDTNKYYKIKYSLTEVIAIAYSGCDEDGDEPLDIAMKYKTTSREGILRQLKSGERVDRSIFDDILDGYAPMDITAFRDTAGYPVGATFVKTEWLLDNVSYTRDPGKITTTMTIFSFEEFDPLQ